MTQKKQAPMALIKTWRERIGAGADFPMHAPTDVEQAMQAEIDELRSCLTPEATIAAAAPGTIRPGVGEARPPRERRRYPESGME